MRVVLGVCGGIAAYKAALLLRLFTEAGHEVTVVPTESSLKFVGAATWEALSGRKAVTGVFEDVDQVRHVRLGQEADLVVVAPATADFLARAAQGMANDLLTTTLLMASCPVVLAPAMHTEMWLHPATRANVETLRGRGVSVLEPASGRLTGRDSGPGRLDEPENILREALAALGRDPARAEAAQSPRPGDSAFRPLVVVTAGGTREPVDPVRFLGNSSSGKQGIAVALEAADQGMEVLLLHGSVEAELPAHPHITVVSTPTAEAMRRAVLGALFPDGEGRRPADALVMAAAVADFRPATRGEHKLKKDASASLSLELVRTPDILSEAVGLRGDAGASPVIVGFAAETGDDGRTALEHAREKLKRKKCDLLVFNDVSQGKVFGQDSNAVVLLAPGRADQAEAGTKREVAEAIVERMWELLADPG